MRMELFDRSVLLLLAWNLCCGLLTLAQDTPQRPSIDFSRDIRPILSDNCFICHGPDHSQNASEYQLDTPESALAAIDGRTPIVPGDADASELIRRIQSPDPDLQMPPPDSGRQLTSQQADLLTEWIRQGAEWNSHWSLRPVSVIPPPVLTNEPDAFSDNAANPIDAFIFDQLQRSGLSPSVEASRETLIRRVSLDITGLPPTIGEIEDFVNDRSHNAWEKLVDRLLLSPRYGERMAMDWLDAARYADTSGYQNDGPREMWRWRDWVIDAFNSNMPFDQFTIEQLAGDLLPQPSLQQKIATGFNRNHRGNAEGGIIPEEYQVEYVVDRVDTTFAVWLGLTMGCARCHDHKYDPLTQREYYQVFAFFNNIPEHGRAIKEGNSPPLIKAPTPDQQLRLKLLDRQIAELAERVQTLQKDIHRSQAAWESSLAAATASSTHSAAEPLIRDDASIDDGIPDDWTITDGLLHRFQFDGSLLDQVIQAPDIGDFGYFDRFSFTCWIRPESEHGTILSRVVPIEEGSGYSVHLHAGRLQVNLVKRWLDDAIRIESAEPLQQHTWQHLAITYDGSRRAEGIAVYRNGQPLAMDVHLDQINQTFAEPEQPFRIGGGYTDLNGAIDELHIYGRPLAAEEIRILALPKSIQQLLQTAEADRSADERLKLRTCFIDQHAPEQVQEMYRQLTQLQRRRAEYYENIPSVMIMQEMNQPRPTFLLDRGQYDQPREPVSPGLPAAFPSWPANAQPSADERPDRLHFARWMVAPENPLTARVAVNRIWQQLFGAGLVRTPEDFGVQGDWPTHPELLDWLAAEFVRNGWDVKAIQRLILTSATYRQSSIVSDRLLLQDPENRLLARGPRHRLPAEVIRDQALAVSGLLAERTGGPSVRPYQPEGLWKEIAIDTSYEQSTAPDLYRRSLYTYWKRTVAPPTMATLDATTRESCVVLRSRTNTPLQALALMNETGFVESARVLAEQVLRQVENAQDQQLELAFRMATCRMPRPDELAILCRQLDESRMAFERHPAAAQQLLMVGESVAAPNIHPAELAAFTTVTSLILNLDEVLNKE